MTQTTYGYMRVSTKEQNEFRQLDQLLAFGIPENHIYMDKLSGKDFNRPAYRQLVEEILQPGDRLVVKSIDRLGRNYHEILSQWKWITQEKKADITILDMPLLDTSRDKDLIGTLISDIVLQLLSFIAENERETIRRRQREGIESAKRRGVRFGRPCRNYPHNFPEICRQWKEKEITPRQAFTLSGLPSYTFYKLARRLDETEKPGGKNN